MTTEGDVLSFDLPAVKFEVEPAVLAAAVAVLNEHRHHGHSGWRLWVEGNPMGPSVLGEDEYEHFTAFEAVAIAMLYATAEEAARKSDSIP